jgi:hypothetical protein
MGLIACISANFIPEDIPLFSFHCLTSEKVCGVNYFQIYLQQLEQQF